MKTVWKRLKQYVDGQPPQSDPLTLTDPATIAAFKEQSKEMRAGQSVCPLSSGGVLLLKAEDVKLAFSNPVFSNQPSRFSALAPKNKDKYVAASVASNILPFLDGHRHVVMRQWASRAFFAQVRAFEGQLDAIAVRHCAAMDAGTPRLLVEDVARHYVIEVISKFIGIEPDPHRLKTYTSALFRLFAPAYDAQTFAETNDGLEQARASLAKDLKNRRKDNAPCLLNAFDETYPEELVQDDRNLIILDNALLFLADGVENVEAAVCVVMARYAQEPQAMTTDYVRQAIAQDTPGQTIARIASNDMAIGDTSISAGTPVFLSLASANDDSASDEDFTFGRGRHKCLGENFAIATVTALCRELVAREPRFNLDALSYRAVFGHKWPRGVTITLTR